MNDISLTAQTGEVVAIIGPNGSSKSLLCRTIADPDIGFNGQIIINHFDARREPDKTKRQVGYAAAERQMEPYLTGFEYLELIGSFCQLAPGVRERQILTLAEQFGCVGELYTLGERQTLALNQKIRLIASLLAEPPLVVWDEPTLFLDELGRQQVMLSVKKLAKNGTTVVMATNDVALAETIADRIVVMMGGQVLTEGTVGQINQLAGTPRRDLAAAFRHLTAHD